MHLCTRCASEPVLHDLSARYLNKGAAFHKAHARSAGGCYRVHEVSLRLTYYEFFYIALLRVFVQESRAASERIFAA